MGSIIGRSHPTTDARVLKPTANGTKARRGSSISQSTGSQSGRARSTETRTQPQPRKDSAESIRIGKKQTDDVNDVSKTVSTSSGVVCTTSPSRTASGVITCTWTVTVKDSRVLNSAPGPALNSRDSASSTISPFSNSEPSHCDKAPRIKDVAETHGQGPTSALATSDSDPRHCSQNELQAKAADADGEQTLVTSTRHSSSATTPDSKPHRRDQEPQSTEDATVTKADIVTSEHEIAATHPAPDTAKYTNTDITAASDHPVCDDNLISSLLEEISISSSATEQDPTADSITDNGKESDMVTDDSDSKITGAQHSQITSERKTASASDSPNTTEPSNPENPSPSSKLSDSESSSPDDPDAPEGFRTVKVKDFVFTVLKRYKELKCIGSGAQGIVW